MHPVLDEFEKVCVSAPDHPAASDQNLSLDYQGFRAGACGLGQRIKPETERPRVGILAPTSSAAAVAIFACWYAGKVPVPLNPLLGPAEFGKVVRDAGLDLVLTIERFAAKARDAGLRTFLLNDQAFVPAICPVPEAAPDDVAVVLYTSGTSGDPKGVCLSFDNLARNVGACIDYARIDPAQVFFSVLPQFHCFGLTAMTVTPLLLGATAYYLPRFSPVAVAQTIAKKKVAVLMAVPSMYAALANMKSVDRDTFASLTLAISGGEPLPQRIYDAFAHRFGVTIYEGYGMTEASPVISLNTPWAHRPGSVGRPIPGVSVTAIDESGNELLPGEDGELVVRGHCVMLGYHNKPAETAAAIHDGALWTGDVGHVDADGYVHITGRVKEMIIVGGENVFPREIENALLGHPAVSEVAVIGVRDEVRGELPAAFVILKDGVTATEMELRDSCRRRLAGYKVPRWVTIAEDLPRSPTGKILKRSLTPAPSWKPTAPRSP